jgi:FkbM family methyltransferase
MFAFAKIYALLYVTMKKVFGKNIRGLGFILRRVSSGHIFEVAGRRIWFNHKVAATYGTLIAGIWQEPETHSLLKRVIESLTDRVAFIDVGANIGAMMIDVSRYPNVSCYGFEPSSECVQAINKSMRLNGNTAYTCFQKLVGDTVCERPFYEGNDVEGASILSQDSVNFGELVTQTTLDTELNLTEDHVIILIDVEGYEPQVLRGGHTLVAQHRPLIIFEYNYVSKKHYSIHIIRDILGDSYFIVRLRQDAKLDMDVENAWNCVAIPRGSVFEQLLSKSYYKNAK